MELRVGISQAAIEQWGKILGDTVNLKIINFPVSFNECFGGLALFNGDPVAAAEYATITDITNTNFKIYMYANNAGTGYTNANIFYLFLGAQQQWGFEETETKTIAFPISFESIKYVFLSKIYGPASGGADTVAYNFFRKSLTGVSFDYAYTRNWLAIGGQQPQWGINTGGAVRTSTLPIPFTNVFLAVASTSSEWCCPGCSATNTTVTTRAYQSNRPDVAQPNDVNWIIIGCQPQWGYSTGGSGAWALKFNGVYTAVVVGAPGFPAREFCGFTFDYTLTGWSFTAGYNSPISYIRPTTTAISLGY